MAILSSYKKLLAWQKANSLVRLVYKTTLSFPKSETYGITSQLRRAALSAVLNIIEGYARNNKKEFYHFLRIAYASLIEAEYLLEFAFAQDYFLEKDFQGVDGAREECGRVLWRLLKSQE